MAGAEIRSKSPCDSCPLRQLSYDDRQHVGLGVERAVQATRRAGEQGDALDLVKNWSHLTGREARALAECTTMIIGETCEFGSEIANDDKQAWPFRNGSFHYGGYMFSGDDAENLLQLRMGEMTSAKEVTLRRYYDLPDTEKVKVSERFL
jgi:hypothetical protein